MNTIEIAVSSIKIRDPEEHNIMCTTLFSKPHLFVLNQYQSLFRPESHMR